MLLFRHRPACMPAANASQPCSELGISMLFAFPVHAAAVELLRYSCGVLLLPCTAVNVMHYHVAYLHHAHHRRDHRSHLRKAADHTCHVRSGSSSSSVAAAAAGDHNAAAASSPRPCTATLPLLCIAMIMSESSLWRKKSGVQHWIRQSKVHNSAEAEEGAAAANDCFWPLVTGEH